MIYGHEDSISNQPNLRKNHISRHPTRLCDSALTAPVVSRRRSVMVREYNNFSGAKWLDTFSNHIPTRVLNKQKDHVV